MRALNLPGRLFALASVGILLAHAGCTRQEPAEIGRAGRPGVEERVAPEVVPPAATEEQPPAATQGQAGYRPPEEGEGVTVASEARVQVVPLLPREIRQGQSFTYQLQVNNESPDMTLRNVMIRQQLPPGMTIESSDPPMQRVPPRDVTTPTTPTTGQPAGQQPAQAAGQQAAQQPDQAAGQQAAAQPGSEVVWMFESMEPGANRTIEVTALADQAGPMETCFISSHETSKCVAMQIVRPELELVKVVPEVGNTCQTMVFVYNVTNTGTGASSPLILRDDLGPGLRTIDGKQEVAIQVDPVEAGQVAKFEVRVIALEPGQHGTRAVVTSEEADLAIRSNQPVINIEEADLALAINAPQVQYLNQLMNVTLRVANRGSAPAPDVRLLLNPGEGVAVVRRGNPSEAREVQQPIAPQAQAEPQPAQQQPGQPPEPQQQQQQAQQRQAAAQQQARDPQAAGAETAESIDWELGTIGPNQEVQVELLLRATRPGVLVNEAVAQFICGPEGTRELTRAVAVARTEIQALPALLIEVIDEQDPVGVGEEVRYRVVVANEGNARDDNVQVSVEVPQELEILDVTGPTQGQIQGNQLTLGTIDTLAPGETATWLILARATAAGDVRFTGILQSASLTKPARAEEPTRLFDTGQTGQQQLQRQQQQQPALEQ